MKVLASAEEGFRRFLLLWVRRWSKLFNKVHFQAGDGSRDEQNDQHCNIHLLCINGDLESICDVCQDVAINGSNVN